MQQKTSSTVYEAPRWAGVSCYLKDQAFLLGVQLEIEVEKGWIRENGRFRVTGPADKVDQFMAEFEEAGRRYNEPSPRKS